MSEEAPSHLDFLQLSGEEQAAVLKAEEQRVREDKRVPNYEVESEARMRVLLGADCPPLERRLFDCLCDGCVFWRDALTPSRRPVRWGPLTLWLDGFHPLADSEVLEIVFQVNPRGLRAGRLRVLKRKLSALRKSLKNRLSARRVPLRVVCPCSGFSVLHDETLHASEKEESRRSQAQYVLHSAFISNTSVSRGLVEFVRPAIEEMRRRLGKRFTLVFLDFVGAPSELIAAVRRLPVRERSFMSLLECKEFLRSALAEGPRPVTVLKRDCEARGCRAGTFRKACRTLRVVRKRDGFGPGGRWLVSILSTDGIDQK